MPNQIQLFLKRTYRFINPHTRGVLGLFVLTVRRYIHTGASGSAASLAYYAFFSLFPLLLVLVSGASFALESDQVQAMIFEILSTTIPVSAEFITTTIEQVLRQRGTVGLLGLIGLAWSASGGFSVLVQRINTAWPGSATRGYFRRRVLGLGMILAILGLFVVWFLSNIFLDALPRFLNIQGIGAGLFGTLLWGLISNLIPLFFTYLLLLALYRWVPNHDVQWTVASWGALVAAVGWELVTNLFTWYISSGFGNYALVYGSLGAIVAFMFWIYLMSQIVLFGAYFSATVGHFYR
jgi:membrane protein